MDKALAEAVRRDFLEWSGGFPPESEMEIFVYIEYARTIDNDALVGEALRRWSESESRTDPASQISCADVPVVRTINE